MAGETVITVVGNVTGDPELRYTQAGKAVANLTIASTPRTFDRTSNSWKDGEALFLRGSVWDKYAEHVAASLVKGSRVIATGVLKQQSWEDKKTGEKRTAMVLEIQEIGPVLRYGTTVFSRPQEGETNWSGATEQTWVEPKAETDVWAQQVNDETPF